MKTFLVVLAFLCGARAQPVLANTAELNQQNSKQLADASLMKKVSSSPAWSAMLHVKDGVSNINDPYFLLSHANFSVENELVATIGFLYGGDKTAVCRFPARYLWLRQELGLPELPIGECEELQEFRKNAPIDQIALVFASENISQASSMMGHVFLKLSGSNESGNSTEHAISFFTDAGGINLPKLFFDSLVVGKKGYFTLSPYQEKLKQYLKEEQRSIWEYELRLNNFQKTLIQAHLIELKQTEFVYFFQKYNCASIIDFIVSMVASHDLESAGFWLTPKDVIKRANALNLIASTRLLPPNRWLIRALSEQLSAVDLGEYKRIVDLQQPLPTSLFSANDGYLKFAFVKAYHDYRVETKQISSSDGQQFSSVLKETKRQYFPTHQIEANAFKNPIDTPQDSQVEGGFIRQGNHSFARLTWTPISHHLDDDNRQYFSENELLLFEVSILKDLKSRQLLLDRFILYGAKSLTPYDALSGGISGAIRLGVEPQYDANLVRRNTAFISGGAGITQRLGRDIDVFAMFNLGLLLRSEGLKIYFQPELGFITREIFNMKSSLSLKINSKIGGDQMTNLQYRFTQSAYLQDKRFSLHLTLETYRRERLRLNSVEFGLRKLF